MPIAAVAAIGAVGSIAAGAMQASAAKKAASAQERAADKQVALQREIYQQNRKDALPWLDAGKTALDAYMGELGLSDAAKKGTFQSQFKERLVISSRSKRARRAY